MKTLGLDVGEKRVGVALSDDSGRIAFPTTTLTGDIPLAELIANIIALAHNHNVQRLVVGMPISLSGQAGPAAAKVAQFVAALRSQSDLEIAVWDERLTTAQAEKAMRDDDVSPSRRRGDVDKIAAALILQNYLDAHTDDDTN